ncbi:hypothetical protein ISS05_01045 [Candidatus Woesearchaeota archaeon]|nr:hypothetical protein [Candidatus Woesearchaeota archaeon]
MNHTKQIKIGNILTSEIEIRDLIKAWIAISIAFGILIAGTIFSIKFYSSFIIASLTVGVGFLFHELGHKIVAQHYGCFAEFRAFNQMLILAIIMSFFGFIFAAPGAVMISGPVGKKRNGKISLAGPAVNVVLAVLFLAFLLSNPEGIIKTIAFYGFLINTWLALFNMIPFGNFDGAKILRWNKTVYGVFVFFVLVLMFMQSFMSMSL